MYIKYRSIPSDLFAKCFTSAGAMELAGKKGLWSVLVDSTKVETVTEHMGSLTQFGNFYIAKDKDTMLRGFKSVAKEQVNTGDANLLICHGHYSEITKARVKMTIARSVPGFLTAATNIGIWKRNNSEDGKPYYPSRKEINAGAERLMLRDRGYFVFLASRKLYQGVPPHDVVTYMGSSMTSYGALSVIIKHDKDIS